MTSQVKELLYIFAVAFVIQLFFLGLFNVITRRKLLQNVRKILITSYFVIIINLTLWPPVMNLPAVSWSGIPYNLEPFNSIVGSLNHSYYMVPLRNIIGNIVLLLPLAFFLKIKGWVKAIFWGLSISLCIESAQVIFTKTGIIFPRSFDVDDLILNTTGFVIGFILKSGIMFVIERLKLRKSKVLRGSNDIS